MIGRQSIDSLRSTPTPLHSALLFSCFHLKFFASAVGGAGGSGGSNNSVRPVFSPAAPRPHILEGIIFQCF